MATQALIGYGGLHPRRTAGDRAACARRAGEGHAPDLPGLLALATRRRRTSAAARVEDGGLPLSQPAATTARPSTGRAKWPEGDSHDIQHTGHILLTPTIFGRQATQAWPLLKRRWDAYWSAQGPADQRSCCCSALDDRTLQDIGMNRSEIESVIYGKSGERTACATIASSSG